jgi:glutaredoxin
VTEAITTAYDLSLTVFGAAWCPHGKRVKKFLAGHRIGYTNVDVDADPRAIERLRQLQAGGQIIPTGSTRTGPMR